MKALLKFRGDYVDVEDYYPTISEIMDPNNNFKPNTRYFKTEDGEIFESTEFDFNKIIIQSSYEYTGTLTRDENYSLLFTRDGTTINYKFPFRDIFPDLIPGSSMEVTIIINRK